MKTMPVIQRNFFRLLRSGTFGRKDEPLEPMSEWKWDRLCQLALMHGVGALVADGIKAYSDDFFLQLSDRQKDNWHRITEETEERNKETDMCLAELFDTFNHAHLRPILLKGQGFASLYDRPDHRSGGDIDIYFPYKPQAEKADAWAIEHGTEKDESDRNMLKYFRHDIKIEHHKQMMYLTNTLLNRRLQKIIDSEIRCCDSAYRIINGTKIEIVPHTLSLLIIIVRMARYIMNEGISLKQLIDFGMFLRKEGDKVDFVKLQKWIGKLQLQHMALLEGALLVKLMKFDEDELPFINFKNDTDTTTITDDIFDMNGSHTVDWFFTQGKHVFVTTSNSNAMLWHIRHTAKFFKYYPAEIFTNFFASFARSLSRIEE